MIFNLFLNKPCLGSPVFRGACKTDCTHSSSSLINLTSSSHQKTPPSPAAHADTKRDSILPTQTSKLVPICLGPKTLSLPLPISRNPQKQGINPDHALHYPVTTTTTATTTPLTSNSIHYDTRQLWDTGSPPSRLCRAFGLFSYCFFAYGT